MTAATATISALSRFLETHPRLVVLSGAGLGIASGIPAYRDRAGVWQHSRPITHQEFVSEPERRQRYWARSLLGWPTMRDARPNAGHLALARLERQGHIDLLITQNVDRLHQRAGSAKVIDLHGRLDQVRCLGCASTVSREVVQQRLLRDNPHSPGQAARPRPDGDAEPAAELVAQIRIPACAVCGGTLMPDVVFFGGTVPRERVEACNGAIAGADALLVVGSSLQVYSGFRFCRLASELGKPIAIINPGITRGDSLASLKLAADCEPLLTALAAASQAPAPQPSAVDSPS